MSAATLDDQDLDGVFVCAETAERVPGVLALGGSDGGVPQYFERLLAAERCACLAGLILAPIYDRGLDGVAADDAALIPIERATGPILLISGGDDRMWPASRMSRMLVDRARRFGREQLVRHLDFPEAGHALFAVDPVADFKQPLPFDLGGSEAAQAGAHEVAWPQVLRVLFEQTKS